LEAFDHAVKSVDIAATTQGRVIALFCKFLADGAANTGSRSDYQTGFLPCHRVASC
jgi:hypothetical protein